MTVGFQAGKESPADLLLRPQPQAAWVSWILAAAMLLCSLATLLHSDLNNVLGGIGYRPYPWQIFTSAFEHGWPGFPLPVHLGLNLALLWKTAPLVERLLGSARFLALTLLALSFYGLARWLTGIDANGASVFIWSYGPMLFLVSGSGNGKGRPGAGEQEIRLTLWILWVAVPVGLAAFLAMGGADLWLAFPIGNAYHISATVAGVTGVLIWRGFIRRRLKTEDFAPQPVDRLAAVAASLIPGFILSIVVLAAVGVIHGAG